MKGPLLVIYAYVRVTSSFFCIATPLCFHRSCPEPWDHLQWTSFIAINLFLYTKQQFRPCCQQHDSLESILYVRPCTDSPLATHIIHPMPHSLIHSDHSPSSHPPHFTNCSLPEIGLRWCYFTHLNYLVTGTYVGGNLVIFQNSYFKSWQNTTTVTANNNSPHKLFPSTYPVCHLPSLLSRQKQLNQYRASVLACWYYLNYLQSISTPSLSLWTFVFVSMLVHF